MEHKIDRLSELPEPLVEHILSFIPLKQILQLTMLSKTWQNVWTLFPILKFDQERGQRKREEFIYFVERTLLSRRRQKISIKRLELQILDIDDECYGVRVNRWIDYAIESNVKEFYICAWPLKYYKVTKSVLTAKSITELTLWGCNLESFHGHDINLSSLKKLVLGEVCNANDQIVKTLIAACLVVEEIEFARCDGLRNIHVSGLSKLMAIEVAFNFELHSLEIEASNLEFLHLKCLKSCQIYLLSCKNLKKLRLEYMMVTDKWLHDVLSKQPLIEILTLIDCDMLERIKISSDCMKRLTFYRCRKLVEVNIVTPNLHRLEYCGDPISFSSNTSTLLEVKLRFWSDHWIYGVEKIEFLSKLNHLKLVTWRAHRAKVF
ncbi:F-box/LRR-repeat protein At3g26922-like [Corylus avellana]|uniref:F-box/LRR-repeat protein At3g26922-like n=1 Tax=Corylus avellana TaxID=13451 RepID=UPI00286B310D|nr:F-box/LRR-repeat protein At3g26922-like [Corylus avellana]